MVPDLAGGEAAAARREPGAVADQLAAEDLAEGMRVIGDWPY